MAWISDHPIEWLAGLPPALAPLPRGHPMSWTQVLRAGLESDAGVHLDVVALRKGIEADVTFTRGNVTFHVLKTRGGLRAPSLFWVDTLLIRRLLRRLRPAVVHAWGTERGAALVASRLGIPALVTIQGLLGWYRREVPLHFHDRVMAMLEGPSLRRARWISTESRFAVEFLKPRCPAAAIHQVEHAPAQVFHEVVRRPQAAPLRLLCVGTLEHRKGTDVLLRALARMPGEIPFELVMTGDAENPFLAPLRRELPSALWSRVRFLGRLRAEEIAGELSVATLLLLPTRADTSPNAVKEAVVAGVPVVATRVGGIPDYVREGENGLLCAPNDIEAFRDTLLAACRHSLFSRGAVEASSLAASRDYLSPARMTESFRALYTQIAAAGLSRQAT